MRAAARNAERTGGGGYAPPVSVSRPACLENGRDDRLRALLHALFVTAARFEDVRGAFGRRIGASGPQYTILAAIAERQGAAGGAGIGIRALADHLHVAPSHITTEVNKLAALGLVEKRANPADGRGVLVRLARPGEAALDRLGPFRREINDILFDGIGRAEFQTLARMFERFLVNTERALDRVGVEERERKRNGHG
jgi:MarR family transcriptional regulator, organic hydroperoxide resistance regulator